jgi:hypothetical protein
MRRSYFGEFYLLANKKSEFLYKAVEEVKAIGIPKGHFLSTLENHEEPYKYLKVDALKRYKESIRKPLVEAWISVTYLFSWSTERRLLKEKTEITHTLF